MWKNEVRRNKLWNWDRSCSFIDLWKWFNWRLNLILSRLLCNKYLIHLIWLIEASLPFNVILNVIFFYIITITVNKLRLNSEVFESEIRMNLFSIYLYGYSHKHSKHSSSDSLPYDDVLHKHIECIEVRAMMQHEIAHV